MNLIMRWMVSKDLSQVMKIQKSSFNPCSLDKKFFSSVISSRRNPSFGFEGFSSFISYVCECNKKVVGFIVYKVTLLDFDKNFHSKKMLNYKNSFPMSGEIVSFCVEESHRRQGVGTHIINSVINRFSSVVELSLKETRSRPFILYSVCSERDLGFHLFLKNVGFKGRTINWNAFGEGHDGYVIVYESLPTHTANFQYCEETVK